MRVHLRALLALLVFTAAGLTSCATNEDDPLISSEREHRGDDGIGPPPCHPASTDPDLDADPC